MTQRMRVVPVHEVEAWTHQRAELARLRSRTARRLWQERARQRARNALHRQTIEAAARREAATHLGEALAQAQTIVTQCSHQLAEVVTDALAAVLRGEVAAAWVRAATQDAGARLAYVSAGELRVAPSQVGAAEQALRALAADGVRLPLTVSADDALASGSVAIVSDAGKVVVELAPMLGAVRQALRRRYDAMARAAAPAAASATEAVDEPLEPPPAATCARRPSARAT